MTLYFRTFVRFRERIVKNLRVYRLRGRGLIFPDRSGSSGHKHLLADLQKSDLFLLSTLHSSSITIFGRLTK